MNVGYSEAVKAGHFDCFVFHDVDLLPENDKNLYCCGADPRHLSVAVDKFDYRLPYNRIMGGATAFTGRQFEAVNGFPNLYWGWGESICSFALAVNSGVSAMSWVDARQRTL